MMCLCAGESFDCNDYPNLVQVFKGMRFYVESLGTDIDETTKAVKDHGGLIVDQVDEATHILADGYACYGQEFPNRQRRPVRRTSLWVRECCRLRTTVWPSKALEWKGWQFQPCPKTPIETVEGGNNFVITLTGYTGVMREALKELIRMTGAQCTPALTKTNTHLLCNTPHSKKAQAARTWGVKVVNHLWIMDSVLTWAWQPSEKYDKSGDIILNEGGWTLLDDEILGSNAIFEHPRFLAEKTWPIVSSPCSEEEDEIPGTPEESTNADAEAARDSPAHVEETQSSHGYSLDEVVGQLREPETLGAPVPMLSADMSAAIIGTASPHSEKRLSNSTLGRLSNGASRSCLRQEDDVHDAASRPSVSFATGHLNDEVGAGRQGEESVPKPLSDNDKCDGAEEEAGLFEYPLSNGVAASQINVVKGNPALATFSSQAASHVLCNLSREGAGDDDLEQQESHDGEKGGLEAVGDQGAVNQVLKSNTKEPSPKDCNSRTISSPTFGDYSPRSSNHKELQSSLATSSRGVRCLAMEFQYDFDDATQLDDVEKEDSGGNSKDTSSSLRAASRSSSTENAGTRAHKTDKIDITDGDAHAPSPVETAKPGKACRVNNRRERAANAGEKSSPGAASFVKTSRVALTPEQSSEDSSRRDGKRQIDVILDQDGDLLHESLEFGHYEDVLTDAMASVSPGIESMVGARKNASRARKSAVVEDATTVLRAQVNSGSSSKETPRMATGKTGDKDTAVAKDAGGWVCQKCTYQNAANLRKCSMCATPKGKALEEGKLQAAPSTAARAEYEATLKASLPSQREKRPTAEGGLDAHPRQGKAKVRHVSRDVASESRTRSERLRGDATGSVNVSIHSPDHSEQSVDISTGRAPGRVLGTRRVSASKAPASKAEDEAKDAGNPEVVLSKKSALGKRPSASDAGTSQPPSKASRKRVDASPKRGSSSAHGTQTACGRVMSGTRIASRVKFVLVCGRTAERKGQAAIVQRLGGHSAYVHGFVPQATHIIVKELRRTEKFLCSCAAGLWILKPAYLEACMINNQWLQEQSFEWNNPRKSDKEQKDLWHGAPRRWRQHWEQHMIGPFAQFKCLVLPGSHPPHDVLEKIIIAGSGEVVNQELEPSVQNMQKLVADEGISHVIVGNTLDSSVSKWLDLKKVPYFKGEYIMDFLALKSRPSHNNPVYKPELMEGQQGERVRR
jgi:hypothetical protein